MPSRPSIARTSGQPTGTASVVGLSQEAHPTPFTRDVRHRANYRPDIDGLRAVAIIPVVIFHAFPGLMPGGFVGVDIFFVISGFLISSIILGGLQRDRFTFSGFYANRIRRIFPALLVVLAVCFVFGWFFLLPDEYSQLGKHIAGGVGYIENFVLRREAGYFDTRSSLKPLMHLWSLGIEEQFYLTYPLLLWLIWRFRVNLLAVLASLAIVSFSLNVSLVRSDSVATFFWPQTRCWELLAGGALAYIHFVKPDPSRFKWNFSRLRPLLPTATMMNHLLSILGLFLIAVAVFRIHESAFPGWWALIPVAGSVLLIMAGPDAWMNRKVLSNKAAVFVGLISYPLYLWHWPLLSFPRILRGGEPPFGAQLAAVILSVVLSWATWRFIENPIRFGRKAWTMTASLMLTSAILGCAGYAAYSHDGFVGRFKNLPEDLGRSQPEQFATAECHKTVGSSEMEYCRSAAPGAPDVLLIGDSHAASLYRGLGPAYRQRSETVMNLGAPGCAPFYDTESYIDGVRQEVDCKAVINRMLDFAAGNPSAHTIILSFRGTLDLTGEGFGEAEAGGAPKQISWAGAAKHDSRSLMFAGALENTVKNLIATGKHVVLFLDWPELGFDPRACLPRPVELFSASRPLCGVPRAQADARNRAYREMVVDLEHEFPGLRVFDPFRYLCDSTACYAMKDGHLLYRDNNHLSAAGAAYLSGKLLEEQAD